jgi:apolipoprotein D and lipocalin family protein
MALCACGLAWVALWGAPVWATSPAAAPLPPLASIERLDLARYLGTWYEIAKYPNVFQRQCAAATQAQYRLRDDGTLEVLNRCRKANGDTAQAVGQARQMGPADSPRLKVRFAPAWLSWLPLVWGDYWVIDIDPAYRLVAVSEPQREYLWILSRTPQVAPDAYQALLGRLDGLGFDLQRLEPTPQP